VEQAKKAGDDQLKGRYALPSELKLVEENEETRDEAKAEWLKARAAKRRRLDSSSSSSLPVTSSSSSSKGKAANPVASLRARLLQNTAQHSPFASSSSSRRSKG
jgi:coiled-coil domain-containing protein 130